MTFLPGIAVRTGPSTLLAFALAITLGGCDRHDDNPRFPPPDPPSNLQVSMVSNAEISLAWTDNATNEEGFIVEQSSDGLSFTQIAVLPADAATTAIAGLSPSTTYYFRIRAYGYRTASAWSNVAGATTAPLNWELLAPSGTPPDPRTDHSAVCAAGSRMVVFGGISSSAVWNDLWTLDLSASPSAWSPITPSSSSPIGRYWHSSIYDSLNQRMILFGGYDINFPANNEVLAFDLSGTNTWSTILPPDPSPAAPSARFDYSLIYDAAHQRMILFGGNDGSSNGLNDLWALNLSGTPTWTRIYAAGSPPTPRYSHSAVYDEAGQRMILFGGVVEAAFTNDAWALSLSGTAAWTKLAPAGIPPSARCEHVAICDGANRRMFVFGGDDGIGPKNDLWVLTLSGPMEWHPVFTGGAAPSVRIGSSAAYDPASASMILFGGWDCSSTYYNEVWRLGL
jgi:hypothetical protein